MASESDISSIPTPAHCTADFCLIPVLHPPPITGITPAGLVPKHTNKLHPDRNLQRFCLRPSRRCAKTDRAIRVEILHALSGDDSRYVAGTPPFRGIRYPSFSFSSFPDASSCRGPLGQGPPAHRTSPHHPPSTGYRQDSIRYPLRVQVRVFFPPSFFAAMLTTLCVVCSERTSCNRLTTR